MHAHLDPDVPIVAIFNNREVSAWELQYINDTSSIEKITNYNHSVSDRGLLWLGDNKLVVVSAPLPEAESLMMQLGYSATTVAYPSQPSQFLCLDILSDAVLRQQLLDYAGANQTLQLIPYAATPQFYELVTALETQYGLKIVLPESPTKDCLWLKNYVDTKAGFRHLVSACLPNADELLPQGFICEDIEQVTSVVRWFHAQSRACILKPNQGWDGVGLVVLEPQSSGLEDQLRSLQLHPALLEKLTVVEEYIHATGDAHLPLFPSVEFLVPRLGKPSVTHICNQILDGRFAGLTISQDLWEQPWTATLLESGLCIANYLQSMGYIGHFDVDAVVNSTGQIRLLEVNARRTGSTHIHELACFLLGADYIHHVSLLSQCSVDSGMIDQYQWLSSEVSDLLYTHEKQKGIILINTSSLVHHKFGYISIAPSIEEVFLLQKELLKRVHILP